MEFNYSSASKYLLKELGASGSFFGGLGAISLNTSLELKRKIKQRHTDLEELSTIKGVLSAQAETVRQINLFLAIVTFIFSLISAPTTFYLTMTLKPIDWMHESKMYMYKEVVQSVELSTDHAQFLADGIKDDIAEYMAYTKNLQTAQQFLLFVMACLILVGFSIFFLRYKWIMSLKECLDSAYIEQEKAIKDKKEAESMVAAIRNNRLMKK